MGSARQVAVVVGSLRKESFCRKIAHALAEYAPANLQLQIVEIGALTLYNQDLDEAPPASWVTFREKIKKADALLFVTPEYNRSTPGVLKNAVDIGSRPYGHSVWNGKPGAVLSATPGGLGAFGANHHLRQALVFLNVPTMQQPEGYYANAGTFFDDAGRVTNEDTKRHLKQFIDAFGNWVEKILEQ